MPTFMQSLASNPGGSGIANQPSQTSNDDVLGIVNRLKDREMQDFKDKAGFMADLSLKQDRLKRIYDAQPIPVTGGQPPAQNTEIGHDPNEITGLQKADLGIKQQAQNLESQRLTQQGKMGEQALAIKGDQEKLNQQKSDQINQNKQADMQRKIDESNQRIQLANENLKVKTDDLDKTIKMHKELSDAMEERHKLELAQKDAQFQATSDQHQQTIDALQQKLKDSQKPTTQVKKDAQGNEITTTTSKGGRVKVTGPNGETGTIDSSEADTLPDGWSAVGQ